MCRMNSLWIVSFLAANLSQASANGEAVKRDIRGVSAGMTIDEAIRAVKSTGGTCKGNQYNTDVDCQFPDRARVDLVNRETTSDRVWRIIYFSPSSLGHEAISYIIETYHLEAPDKQNPTDYVLPSGEHLQFNSSLGFDLSDMRILQEDRDRRKPAFIPPKL